MAVWIKRSTITEALSHKMVTDLTIIPPPDPRGYGGGPPLKVVSSDPLHARIPLFYGRSLFPGVPINYRDAHVRTSVKSSITLKPKQVEVMGEVEGYLDTVGSASILCYPSFGKSILICESIARRGLLTIVVVNRIMYVKQLASAIREHTSARVWVVGKNEVYAGVKDKASKGTRGRGRGRGKAEPKVQWTPPLPGMVDVVVTTTGMLRHIPQETVDACGLLVMDEADTLCAPSYVAPILSIRPRYVVACTATYKHKSDKHKMLDFIVGPHYVKRSMDLPVKVIRWNTGIGVPNSIYSDGDATGQVWTDYINYLLSHAGRNKMLCDFIVQSVRKDEYERALEEQKLAIKAKAEAAKAAREAAKSDVLPVLVAGEVIKGESGDAEYIITPAPPTPAELALEAFRNRQRPKIIVITWRVDQHVIPLVDMLRARGIKADYLSGVKHEYGDVDVLVGAYGKVGRGLDEAASCSDYDGNRISMVILAATTRDPTNLEQAMGRAYRSDDPIVVTMVDKAGIAANHWKANTAYFAQCPNITIMSMSTDKDGRIKPPKVTSKPKARPEEGPPVVGDTCNGIKYETPTAASTVPSAAFEALLASRKPVVRGDASQCGTVAIGRRTDSPSSHLDDVFSGKADAAMRQVGKVKSPPTPISTSGKSIGASTSQPSSQSKAGSVRSPGGSVGRAPVVKRPTPTGGVPKATGGLVGGRDDLDSLFAQAPVVRRPVSVAAAAPVGRKTISTPTIGSKPMATPTKMVVGQRPAPIPSKPVTVKRSPLSKAQYEALASNRASRGPLPVKVVSGVK